jgi:TonB family protein
MPQNRYSDGLTLGLLPEPEGRSASFFTSSMVNLTILALILLIGMTAKRAIDQHKYEQTVLIVPTEEPKPPEKIKLPEPPKVEPPEPPKPDLLKLDTPRINIPKPEPKVELKPIQMDAKVTMPVIKAPKQAVILAPQPKSALASSPMPAQVPQTKVSTAPVHLGQTFGVTPNPNATRPATIAAIGNPYGGMSGQAIAPHGVVGSVGISNGIKPSGNAGVVGKVASAGIPGTTSVAPGTMGKVASAGIPAMTAVAAQPKMVATPVFTNLELLSIPTAQYTPEAKQFKVQGDVILRATFTATGQVVVQNVVRGLGHGLDEEARRAALQIRFRPATRNGQAIDMTTNITIKFQLA